MRTIRIPQPASFALLHWLRNSPETDFPRSDPLAIAKASRAGNGQNLQDLPSGQPYHRCRMNRGTRMVEVSMRKVDEFTITEEALRRIEAHPDTRKKDIMKGNMRQRAEVARQECLRESSTEKVV